MAGNNIMDRLQRSALKTALRTVLDILPLKDIIARGKAQFQAILGQLAADLDHRELADDETRHVYIMDVRTMPDGRVKVWRHVAAQTGPPDETGCIAYRMKEAVALDMYIDQFTGADLPEDEMVEHIVKAVTEQKASEPASGQKALPPSATPN